MKLTRRKIRWLIILGVISILIGFLAYSRGCATSLPEDSKWVQQTAKLEKKLQVDGVNLRVLDTGGDGPAVLLVHGWADSSFAWRGQIPRLKDKYRLVVPDLPGFGYSDKPDPVLTYPQHAKVCMALLDQLGIEKAFMVGNSMGGAVAMRISIDFPDRVRGLVGIAPGTRKDEEDEFRLSDVLEVKVIGEFIIWVMGRMLYKRVVRKATAPGYEIDEQSAEEMYRIFNTPGARFAALDQLREVRNNAVPWDDIGKIRVPTLIIWGDKDQWNPLKYGHRLIKTIPGARLEMVSNAGHVPHWETPEPVARLIDGFIQELLSAEAKEETDAPETKPD